MARSLQLSPDLLDLTERVALVALFSAFTWHHLQAVSQGQAISLLLVLSEGLVAAFVLFRRRARQMSMRLDDWLVACLGTLLPLQAAPAEVAPLVPMAAGAGMMVAGIALQVHAKLILRRSFGMVAANRGVVRGGPYRLVRHPMYLGYLTTHVGYLLLVPTVWNLTIYGAALVFQILRIRAEERLLVNDPHYQEFRTAVRFRLVPGIY